MNFEEITEKYKNANIIRNIYNDELHYIRKDVVKFLINSDTLDVICVNGEDDVFNVYDCDDNISADVVESIFKEDKDIDEDYEKAYKGLSDFITYHFKDQGLINTSIKDYSVLIQPMGIHVPDDIERGVALTEDVVQRILKEHSVSFEEFADCTKKEFMIISADEVKEIYGHFVNGNDQAFDDLSDTFEFRDGQFKEFVNDISVNKFTQASFEELSHLFVEGVMKGYDAYSHAYDALEQKYSDDKIDCHSDSKYVCAHLYDVCKDDNSCVLKEDTNATNVSTKSYYPKNESLYKFAQDNELNSYEFDIIKRVVRCRKKGQFVSDLLKTMDVVGIYLMEQSENFDEPANAGLTDKNE